MPSPTPQRRPLCRGLAALVLILAALAPARAQQVTRFDGGSDDRAQAIAVDATGATYVAGEVDSTTLPVSFAVVKHNAQGALQWVARYSGDPGQVNGSAWSVAVDAAGNVYAAGYIGRQVTLLTQDVDWLVVSYTPAGVQRWAHIISSPNGLFESAGQVAVSPAGAIYVTGQTGTSGNMDWLTVKYAPDGTVLWQRTLAGTAGGDDRPSDLQAGSDGGLTVLGYTTNTFAGGTRDLTLARYDAQGAQLWTRNFSDTSGSEETPGGLVVDAAGNTYVTASTQAGLSAELPSEPLTLKYDGAGNLTWLIKRDTAGGSSIALAPDGNLVASGTAIGDAGTFLRFAVSKFDPTGAQVWTSPQDTDGRVAVDAAGNVFVAGTRFTSGFDFYAVKLTSAGQELWRQTYADGGLAGDSLLAPNGDLLVTGLTDGANPDLLTLRYLAGSTPTPPAQGPAAPSGLSLAAAKSKLTLQWTDNSNNETGFLIERAVNGGAFAPIAQVGANVRTYANTGLSKNNTYAYRVRAFNAGGNSAYSNTATGKPK